MKHAIILAAGKGRRMSSKKDKMLALVKGKPLLYYSIMAFNDHPEIKTITIVCNKNNQTSIKELVKTYKFLRVKKIIIGAETRQKSVEKGVAALSKVAKNNDLIIVHNGANPLPSFDEISEAIEQANEVGACIVGHFVKSTIKEVNKEEIIKTHDRTMLFEAETPQVAKYSILKKAIESAKKTKLVATDEAMLLEAIGQKVKYIEADENNFKITSDGDLAKFQALLGEIPADFLIGFGQDSHMFCKENKGLSLGGLYLENELMTDANSDGDVVLHSIFNGLSQAIGDKSLGFYADTECEKGVTDSKKYLEIILKKVKKKGLVINSLGIMIECKTPKIDPLVAKMKKSLSEILEIPSRRVGITATSGEDCTSFGLGHGIQCFSIISLIKKKEVD